MGCLRLLSQTDGSAHPQRFLAPFLEPIRQDLPHSTDPKEVLSPQRDWDMWKNFQEGGLWLTFDPIPHRSLLGWHPHHHPLHPEGPAWVEVGMGLGVFSV